jgi:hypothetical protein
MASWEISTGRVENESPPLAVARYEALVTIGLEHSSLIISAEAPLELAIRAILTPPQWTLHPWSAPAPEASSDASAAQLEEWALHKFKALFDFAAVLEDGTAREMEFHLLERFPSIRDVRTASTTEVSRYKRIFVHAEILENGDAQWGFDLPEEGELPPGIPGLYVADPGATFNTSDIGDNRLIDLDVFVQNTVRIDIQRRLEKSAAAAS